MILKSSRKAVAYKLEKISNLNGTFVVKHKESGQWGQNTTVELICGKNVECRYGFEKHVFQCPFL